MNELVEIVINLFNLFQITAFLLLLGVFIGAIDEWRNKYSRWRDVFYLLYGFTLTIVILQVVMVGISGFGLKEPPRINFSSFIFMWGFRVVALVSLLRVLWPAKHWWSDTEPSPRYPRVKLFIYSLLALGLSFSSISLVLSRHPRSAQDGAIGYLTHL